MGLWNRIQQQIEERNVLIQYRHQLQDAYARDDPADVSALTDIVDKHETAIRLRSAWKHGVPIPDRPRPSDDNEFWNWRFSIGTHVLTDKGHAFIRREVAHEKDIARRPWLAWGGLLTGIAGLCVSLLVAFFK